MKPCRSRAPTGGSHLYRTDSVIRDGVNANGIAKQEKGLRGYGIGRCESRTLTPLILVRIQVPQPYNTDRAVRRGCCASDPWRATLSVRSNLDFESDNRRA